MVGSAVSRFSSLHIMRVAGPGRLWKLVRPLVYEHPHGWKVEVPAGMIADGNSGPLKHAENEPPGWLHDYLYRVDAVPRLSRSEADDIFCAALISEGRPAWRAYIQWAAVRAFGASSWRRKRVNL
jgi:hypothetical protein